MSELVLRRAELKDAGSISDLLRKVSLESPYMGDVGLYPPEHVLRAVFESGRLAGVLATAGTLYVPDIAGYAQSLSGAERPVRHVAQVTIAVAAKYRHMGLGVRLLKGLEQALAGTPVVVLRASVWEPNAASRRLFETCRYNLAGSLPDHLRDPSGQLWSELVYVRKVG